MIDLSSIRSSGAVFPPQKVVVYGVQGLGKTTFACTFEKPVLIRTEDGAAALNVPTFPMAKSYADVVEMIQALHGEHDFRSVVVDSLDWLEPMVWAQTCARAGYTSIEAPGYGKGYVDADEDWTMLMQGLDSLRFNRGMHVILVAHSEIKTFTPPDAPAYDRYQIKLHKRAWAKWQEWSDMTLFVDYERQIIQTKTQTRAESTGNRIIHTEERPAWLAKNRWNLPPEIKVGTDRTWSAFHSELAAATGGRYSNGAVS